MRCAYHADYHYPLPEGHAFPMGKFREARHHLGQQPLLRFIEAPRIPDADLERVHTPAYLAKLRTGGLSGDELYRLGLPWRPELLDRSALEVGGTVVATWAAIEDGAAANLAGGTHHAFADRGEGYCVLNDVVVALRALAEAEGRRRRVAVIDTDAHQGNGTHALTAGDPQVFTFSIHGARNYPSAKVAGSLDVGLPREVPGADYLEALSRALPEVMERSRAELVFWVSGADIHQNDRFGQMQLSWEEVAARDELVLQATLRAGVPVVCVYGGGYNRTPGYTARLHVATVERLARAWAGSKVRPSAGLPCGGGSETLAPA